MRFYNKYGTITIAMKICIHKTGHQESFFGENSSVVSLGDVLRTTVILHLFKDDEVVWITSCEAQPLLKNNPFISKLILGSETDLFPSELDLLIDLESNKATLPINAKKIINLNSAIRISNLWQENLYHLLGKKWRGEEYVLAYESSHENPSPVIGLNWQVGPKMPLKTWEYSRWEALSRSLSNDFIISWQRGMNNLDEYINWISSCDLLVTTDSLGLHLALALKKKVVAIFGPTNFKEVYLYERGKAIQSPTSVMSDVHPENVLPVIYEVFSSGR